MHACAISTCTLWTYVTIVLVRVTTNVFTESVESRRCFFVIICSDVTDRKTDKQTTIRQYDVIIPPVAACSRAPHNTVSQKKLCCASYSVYTPGTKIKTETTSTFGERNRHTQRDTQTHRQRDRETERDGQQDDVINSRRVPWRWCPSLLWSPCICLSRPPTRLQWNKQLDHLLQRNRATLPVIRSWYSPYHRV